MGGRYEDLAERLWPDNLQEVQDSLSTCAGIPILFAHPTGRPLTACEDLTDFCRSFTRAVALSRPCLGCRRLDGRDGEGPPAADRLLPFLHWCPLGLMHVAVPIKGAGEEIGYLITGQVRPGGREPLGADEESISSEPEECTAFAAKLPRRSQAELEGIAACLSAVAWLTGSLTAARRRNLRLAEHIREQSRHLQQHVTTDAVTGAANRRRFCSVLDAEVARARRYGHSLSIAVLDVEGFRTANDEFGHDVGDAILRSVAERLTSTVRQTDLVGRVGGDEFAILFPETTRTEAMIALARIHSQINDLNASGELPVEVRLTAGIADRPGEADDLLAAAAEAERQSRALSRIAG